MERRDGVLNLQKKFCLNFNFQRLYVFFICFLQNEVWEGNPPPLLIPTDTGSMHDTC